MKLLRLVITLVLTLAPAFGPAFAESDPPPRMTKAEAAAFLERWFPAWVGGVPSVERLVAFYAPDAVYVDPNVPKGIQGHDELRRFFTIMLGNHPDWKFEAVAIYPTEKGFILNWKADIPWKGTVIRDFKGVDILEFDREGRITRHEDYFDLSVFRAAN